MKDGAEVGRSVVSGEPEEGGRIAGVGFLSRSRTVVVVIEGLVGH